MHGFPRKILALVVEIIIIIAVIYAIKSHV